MSWWRRCCFLAVLVTFSQAFTPPPISTLRSINCRKLLLGPFQLQEGDSNKVEVDAKAWIDSAVNVPQRERRQKWWEKSKKLAESMKESQQQRLLEGEGEVQPLVALLELLQAQTGLVLVDGRSAQISALGWCFVFIGNAMPLWILFNIFKALGFI
jgi:hypothetical protein